MYSRRKQQGNEDFIIKEIEKIGLIIQALLGKLQEQKKGNEIVTENSEELPFEIENLPQLSIDVLDTTLTEEKGFSAFNIELLGDYFAAKSNTQQQLHTALKLYELATKRATSFSITLPSKVKHTQEKLDQL